MLGDNNGIKGSFAAGANRAPTDEKDKLGVFARRKDAAKEIVLLTEQLEKDLSDTPMSVRKHGETRAEIFLRLYPEIVIVGIECTDMSNYGIVNSSNEFLVYIMLGRVVYIEGCWPHNSLDKFRVGIEVAFSRNTESRSFSYPLARDGGFSERQKYFVAKNINSVLYQLGGVLSTGRETIVDAVHDISEEISEAKLKAEDRQRSGVIRNVSLFLAAVALYVLIFS